MLAAAAACTTFNASCTGRRVAAQTAVRRDPPAQRPQAKCTTPTPPHPPHTHTQQHSSCTTVSMQSPACLCPTTPACLRTPPSPLHTITAACSCCRTAAVSAPQRACPWRTLGAAFFSNSRPLAKLQGGQAGSASGAGQGAVRVLSAPGWICVNAEHCACSAPTLACTGSGAGAGLGWACREQGTGHRVCKAGSLAREDSSASRRASHA